MGYASWFFCFSSRLSRTTLWEGEKGIHGRSSMRPTVGRLDDLQ